MTAPRLLTLLLASCLCSCAQLVEDLGRAANNELDPPTVRVDAGGPYHAELASGEIQLDGSVRLPADGRLERIHWTVEHGAERVELLDPGSLQARLRLLAPGEVQLRLELHYDLFDYSSGRSASDQALLLIVSAAASG